MMTTFSADAQTSLVGRVYHNPNIMSDMYKDMDKIIANMKANALVKMEQKKGRKLNEKETKEFNESLNKEISKYKTCLLYTSPSPRDRG